MKFSFFGNVTTDHANAIFDPASLENSPEHWDKDPKYSQVYKDSVQEIFFGPNEDFDGQIVIVKIMEEVKECQGNRYAHRVFYADIRRPAGSIYMTPYQRRQYLCYRDLLSLD